MSPLRWDVLGVGFLLTLPLLALGLRGNLTPAEVTARLPWCLLAGYVVATLLRYASRPWKTPGDGQAADPDPSTIT